MPGSVLPWRKSEVPEAATSVFTLKGPGQVLVWSQCLSPLLPYARPMMSGAQLARTPSYLSMSTVHKRSSSCHHPQG